ncbi:MAG: transglutaminase domain-containing protein [Bdellovibrionaceae bacterium]|nr:transglutaminase domain-containing protein [Bdellovibrio sp.]
MGNRITKIVAYLIIVSILFTFTSCVPASSDSTPKTIAPPPTVTALKTLEQNCLENLKERMHEGEFSFEGVRNQALAAAVKDISFSPIQDSEAAKYGLSFNLKKNKATSMNLTRNREKNGYHEVYDVEVNTPDTESASLFNIKLSYKKTEHLHVDISFEQQFKVDSACKLSLARSKFSKKTTLDSKKLSILSIEEFADSKAGSFRTLDVTADIPQDGLHLTEVDGANLQQGGWSALKAFLTSERLAQGFFMPVDYSPYFLKINIEFAKDFEHYDPLVNRIDQFHQLAFNIQNVGSIAVGYSRASKFTFSRFGTGDESWNVDASAFNQTLLTRGNSQTARSFKIGKELDELSSPLQVHFHLSRQLDYPSFDSYWKIDSQSNDKNAVDSLKFNYQLTSQPSTGKDQLSDSLITKITDQKNNPFLQETANVQISNPQVQAMIAELKRNKSLNRLQMARLVGKLVTETITYDYDSVNGGTVHALTTAEVLERKTGVCQHFANLFTALARGVGIPTRLVTGYYLSAAGAGGHAWNEIEVRKNVWMPVEPQHADLNLNPTHYLPLLYGGYMETMDDKDLLPDGIKMMIEFEAEAQPGV